MPIETTPLVGAGSASSSPSLATGKPVEMCLMVVQVIFVVLFVLGTTYSEEDYKVKEYIAFRDIMAMLLLSFGKVMD